MHGARVKPPRRSPEYQRAAVTYSAALRLALRERNMTRTQLARAVGVSPEAAGNYLRASYIPRPDIADAIAHVLVSPRLAELASSGRRIRCAICGRATWRGQTRRRYCSKDCWEKSRINSSQSIPPGHSIIQAAVDAFCGSCEPEGVCRTPECALQPFSPLPLISIHRMGAA